MNDKSKSKKNMENEIMGEYPNGTSWNDDLKHGSKKKAKEKRDNTRAGFQRHITEYRVITTADPEAVAPVRSAQVAVNRDFIRFEKSEFTGKTADEIWNIIASKFEASPVCGSFTVEQSGKKNHFKGKPLSLLVTIEDWPNGCDVGRVLVPGTTETRENGKEESVDET